MHDAVQHSQSSMCKSQKEDRRTKAHNASRKILIEASNNGKNNMQSEPKHASAKLGMFGMVPYLSLLGLSDHGV